MIKIDTHNTLQAETFAACRDCLHLAEFGAEALDYTDATAVDAYEAGTTRLQRPGGHWISGGPAAADDEPGPFTRTPCEICRRPLAGERYAVSQIWK